MTYSPTARRAMNQIAPDIQIVMALEITHPDLAVPVRVVNDSRDCVIEGNLYQALRFEITLPDAKDQQVPRASLSISNIGRKLTQWLEASNGGKGAKCRVLQVLLDAPPVLEFDVTMDLTGLSVNNLTVSGELGYQSTLNQSAVALRYDPPTAPGLF